jgi:hypothetical protein
LTVLKGEIQVGGDEIGQRTGLLCVHRRDLHLIRHGGAQLDDLAKTL